MQPTRKEYNGEKIIMGIARIKNQENKEFKFIIGAIHTENGVSLRKWGRLKKQLEELKTIYQYQIMIYCDINADITFPPHKNNYKR